MIFEAEKMIMASGKLRKKWPFFQSLFRFQTKTMSV